MTTRRSFLLNSGLTAAALVSAPMFIRADVKGANDKLVMGLIGTGRQCCGHNIPGYVRNKRNQVVALCDVDMWRLAEAKKRVDAIYEKSVSLTKPEKIDTYTDYRELLARSDIDAVMISTPDHWHTQQAVEAMKAGKHVALEKPIIRTIAEGQQLVKTENESKRIFRVDSEFRSGNSAHRAAELIRNGVLGQIKKVLVSVPQSDIAIPKTECPDMPVPPELNYNAWQGDAPKAPYTLNRVHTPQNLDARPGWMRCLYYCDGMITNWGTHLLNGALWALGKDRIFPVEITGTGTYPDASSFWNVLLKFNVKYKYADGLEIEYQTGTPYYHIEGEKGWIEASFDWQVMPNSKEKGIRASSPKLLETVLPDSAIYFVRRTEKEDFIDCCLTGKETLESAEVGHCVTSTLLLGHIAIRTGETVKFNPETQEITGGEKAKQYSDKRILEV